MFRFWAKKRSQVQTYHPVVEGLEGRRLMSATLLDTGAAAELGTSSHGTGAGAGKVSMQDFHFVMRSLTGQGTGKVSMQDFHFVMRSLREAGIDGTDGTDDVTISSGAAGTGGGGAGKVSMQDFHFVMRNNSTSPK